MSRIQVACVFPEGLRAQYGAGNWKDIAGVNSLLNTIGADVREVPQVDGESAGVLLACSEGASDLLVHYSFWPDMLQAVRKQFPRVRIHTRIHNAEPLQHLHREAPGFLPSMKNLRGWYGAANLFRQDARCRSLSDTFLCISEWDRRHYQRLIPGSAVLLDVPYHCPWPRLRPHVAPIDWHSRRDAVVCLAGGRERIGSSQRDGLVSFATNLARTGRDGGWSFELSAGIKRSADADAGLGPVRMIGEVTEPWDFLCGVKALALLTPFGFGCKTTIVDALAAGCNVLVDSRLAVRLPDEIRNACVVLDQSRSHTFAEAFETLAMEPAPNELNADFARKARLMLERALHGSGGAAKVSHR